MSIVNTDIIINKKAPKKSKKAIIMNPHNKNAKKEEHFEEEQQTTQHFSGFIPDELINNSKGVILKGASMIAKSKSDVLYQKISK